MQCGGWRSALRHGYTWYLCALICKHAHDARLPARWCLCDAQVGDVMVFAQKQDGSLVVAGRCANKVRVQLLTCRACVDALEVIIQTWKPTHILHM